jgi:predicted solute-binding protein
MIPYTNMAPYRELGPPRGCQFVPLVPRDSIGALEAGTVAAAAVPVGGLGRLAGIVEPVENFGIAAKGASMSVLLFSRCPFEHLHAPRTLRLTHESASSVRLLFLLLGHTVGFHRLPVLADAGQTPDAELLIGDRALVRGQSTSAGDSPTWVTDLSQLWFEMHGTPFVFARWVVRKNCPQSVKAAIGDWLATFKAQESQLVARAVPAAAERLALPPGVVERYFSAIRRCLADSDLKGQQLFFQQMEQFGREPLFTNAA